MIDVRDLLVKTVEPLNLYLQGSRSGGNYESQYCTYWTDDIEEKYRDNIPVKGTWIIDFNYYSKSLNYENEFNELIKKLRDAGFKTVGRGGDALTDDKNYKGRNIQIKYVDNY